MTHRELRTLLREVGRELGSARAVLESFAGAMHERRELPAPPGWAKSARVEHEFADLLDRDDALAAVYQALNAPALEAAYRATARERGRKFTADEIPAVTGLFTPPWVAGSLIEHTLCAFWRATHPDVAATPASPRATGELQDEACPRLPQPCEGDAGVAATATTIRVRDLRVLDPSCGTMNFGIAAIDVLRGMYRAEMDHAGRRGWPAEPSVRGEQDIGPAILRHNLFGVDIDPAALWLARVSLGMKLRTDATHANLTLADALFDDVGHDFDVVVTNPPYLSARNLPESTVRRLKRRYPSAWRDLYACFIDRCLDLCRGGGRVGMLTMQSFMFTGAFERLRERIDEQAALETLVHFGPGLFDAGNPGTLQTVAFTMRKEPDAAARFAQQVTAWRLVDSGDKQRTMLDGMAPVFRFRQEAFAQLPRRAWAYWASPEIRRAFAAFPRLRDVAPPRQGLATTDNARFVRYGWEVEPTTADAPCRATPGRWFPYAKSGRFRRWYEAPRHRVNWEHDGREIKSEIARRYPYLDGQWKWVAKNAAWYGKSGGLTYSYLTSGRFSARRLEPGSIFDVAGSSLFPPEGEALALLAWLNSSAAARLLNVINPTLNFQVGDLAELPVPCGGTNALATLAAEAIDLQRQLDAFDETSPEFRAPIPWRHADEIGLTIRRRLLEVENEVDRVAAELYGIGNDDRHVTPDVPPTDRADVARRWVSFALGRALGRWGGEPPDEPVIRIRPASAALVRRVREALAHCSGASALDEIESAVGGLGEFLAGSFYAWHVRVYAKRPVYWALGDRSRAALVSHDYADSATVREACRAAGESPPVGWERVVDDGVMLNLAPLAGLIADTELARALSRLNADVRDGRYGWASRGSSVESGPARPGARRRPSASPAFRSAARR